MSRTAAKALTVMAAVLMAAPPARAGEEAPNVARPKPPPRARWYGWQPAIIDGVAIAGAIGIMAHGRAASPWAGYAPLGASHLASLLVHAAHGYPGKGGISFGFRGLAMTSGVILAFWGCEGCKTHGLRRALGIGFVAGEAIGSIVDVAVLAWTGPRRLVDEPRAPRGAPALVPVPGGLALGWSGAF